MATRPLFTTGSGNRKFFYTFDGNKNVSELVHFETRNGIAAHYDYAPFGAVTRSVSASAITDNTFTTDNPFRFPCPNGLGRIFSSEYHDDTLGLVYYNYRHYNPLDARWCGRDPLESKSGFLFCVNRPIDLIDWAGKQIVVDVENILQPTIDKGLTAAEMHHTEVDIDKGLQSVNCLGECVGKTWGMLNVKISVYFYATTFKENIYMWASSHEYQHVASFKLYLNQVDGFCEKLFVGKCESETCLKAKINLAKAFSRERYFDYLLLNHEFDQRDYRWSTIPFPQNVVIRSSLRNKIEDSEKRWRKAKEELKRYEQEVENVCSN